MEQFDPPFYKMASASLTDQRPAHQSALPPAAADDFHRHVQLEEILAAVEAVGTHDGAGNPNLMIAHATSTYPCKVEELNLRMIHTLKDRFPGVADRLFRTRDRPRTIHGSGGFGR